MSYMENARRTEAGAVLMKAGEPFETQNSQLADDVQRVANAIAAGLFYLPKAPKNWPIWRCPICVRSVQGSWHD